MICRSKEDTQDSRSLNCQIKILGQICWTSYYIYRQCLTNYRTASSQKLHVAYGGHREVNTEETRLFLSCFCDIWFVLFLWTISLEWIKTEFMPTHYFKQTNNIIQMGTRWFYQSQSYLQQKISGSTCAEGLSCEFSESMETLPISRISWFRRFLPELKTTWELKRPKFSLDYPFVHSKT